MADTIFAPCVSFACATTAGDQDIVVPGVTETPLLVLTTVVGAVATDVLAPGAMYGSGAVDAAGSQFLFVYADRDNVYPAVSDSGNTGALCLGFMEDLGGSFATRGASFVAMIPGGIRVNWDAADLPTFAALGQIQIWYGSGLTATATYRLGVTLGTEPTTIPVGAPFNILLSWYTYLNETSYTPGSLSEGMAIGVGTNIDVATRITRRQSYTGRSHLSTLYWMAALGSSGDAYFKTTLTEMNGDAAPYDFQLTKNFGTAPQTWGDVAISTGDRRVAVVAMDGPTSISVDWLGPILSWEPGIGVIYGLNAQAVDVPLAGEDGEAWCTIYTDFAVEHDSGMVIQNQDFGGASASYSGENALLTYRSVGGNITKVQEMAGLVADPTRARVPAAGVTVAATPARLSPSLWIEASGAAPPTFEPQWALPTFQRYAA